jgi:cytochrome c-type biogenesis protein CcmE
MNQKKLIIGGMVIAVFLGFGMMSFKKSLTPYVSFAEARSAGRMVQVKGYPDHEHARFDPDRKAFFFTMKDEAGENLNVVFKGPKPGNFEQAQSVVAIGRYHGDALQSEQILVKCPSKYESNYPGATEHPEGIPMNRGAHLEPTPDAAPSNAPPGAQGS